MRQQLTSHQHDLTKVRKGREGQSANLRYLRILLSKNRIATQAGNQNDPTEGRNGRKGQSANLRYLSDVLSKNRIATQAGNQNDPTEGRNGREGQSANLRYLRALLSKNRIATQAGNQHDLTKGRDGREGQSANLRYLRVLLSKNRIATQADNQHDLTEGRNGREGQSANLRYLRDLLSKIRIATQADDQNDLTKGRNGRKGQSANLRYLRALLSKNRIATQAGNQHDLTKGRDGREGQSANLRYLRVLLSKNRIATQADDQNDLTKGRNGREGQSANLRYLRILLSKNRIATQAGNQHDLTKGRDGREGQSANLRYLRVLLSKNRIATQARNQNDLTEGRNGRKGQSANLRYLRVLLSKNRIATQADDQNDLTKGRNGRKGQSANLRYLRDLLSKNRIATQAGNQNDLTEGRDGREGQSANLRYLRDLLSKNRIATQAGNQNDPTEGRNGRKGQSANLRYLRDLLSKNRIATQAGNQNDLTEGRNGREGQSANLRYLRDLLSKIRIATQADNQHDLTEGRNGREGQSATLRYLRDLLSKNRIATQARNQNDPTEGRNGREGQSANLRYLRDLLSKNRIATQAGNQNDLTEGRKGREGQSANLRYLRVLLSKNRIATQAGNQNDLTEGRKGREGQSANLRYLRVLLSKNRIATQAGNQNDLTEGRNGRKGQSANLRYLRDLLSKNRIATQAGNQNDLTEGRDGREGQSANLRYLRVLLSKNRIATQAGNQNDLTEGRDGREGQSANLRYLRDLLSKNRIATQAGNQHDLTEGRDGREGQSANLRYLRVLLSKNRIATQAGNQNDPTEGRNGREGQSANLRYLRDLLLNNRIATQAGNLILHATYTVAVLCIALWGWNATAHAQIPGRNIELPAPHEKIQDRFRYDPFRDRGKFDLTPRRSWKMIDGTTIEGGLVRWCKEPEVVYLQDGNLVLHVPRRQFDPADGAEVDKLIGDHLNLINHLSNLPMTPVPADVRLIASDVPPGAPQGLLLEIKDGWLYSVVGDSFVRTPLSHYSADDLAKFKKNIALFNQPLWKLHSPDIRFRGELLGQVKFAGDRTALLFRGFQHPLGPNFNGQKFLMPKDLLAENDQKRAAELLKSKKLETPIALADAPRVWYPMMNLQGPAGEPVSINGKMLTFRLPRRALDKDGLQDVDSKEYDESQYSLEHLGAEGRLLSMQLVEEKRLRAADPGIDDAKLAEALHKFSDSIIASDPFFYLSPATAVTPRESSDVRAAGRLVGQSGPYWYFEIKSADSKSFQYAVVKSELAPDYVEYGERVLKDLQNCFASHPEIKPPELQTKNRMLRTSHYIAQGEPVAIDNESVELSVPDPTGTRTQKFPLKIVHFKDVEEIRVLLGSAGAPSASPSNPSTAPMDPAARDKALALSQLQTELTRQTPWQFMIAALQGEYQDSLVFAFGDDQILIDPDILDDATRAAADKQLKILASLRQRAGVEPKFELGRPALRLYTRSGAMPVIGKNPVIEELRIVLMDSKSQKHSLTAPELTEAIRFEVRLQMQLDKEFRSQAPAVLSAEQREQVRQLKDRLRAEMKANLAEAVADKTFDNFLMKNCPIYLTGRFVRFDQDDAIFKLNSGEMARVFRVAFTPEAIELMEERQADPKYQKEIAKFLAIPTAEIEYRVMRMSKGGIFLPSIPVGVESERVVVRLKGGLVATPIKSIHPRDVSELRADLYRRKHGTPRDTTIDEKLQEPVAEKDIFRGPVKLQDKWKQRIDTILQPRQLVWQTSQLSIAPTEQILAFSPDSSRILVAPTAIPLEVDTPADSQPVDLKIVDVASGQSQILKGHYLPGTRAYLSADNQSVSLFAAGKLKVVNLATGKASWETDKLKELPLASCQSSDGRYLVALQSDSSLCVIDIERKLVANMPNTDVPVAARRRVWSSPHADHVALIMGSEFRSFRRRNLPKLGEEQPPKNESLADSADEYKAYVIQSVGMNRLGVSLDLSTVYLCNQGTTTCLLIDPANGVLTPQQLTTGLELAWIGPRHDPKNDSHLLHLIGKRADPAAQAANYSFSAYISESASVRHATQTLEVALDRDSLFALDGSAVAYKTNGNWWLAKESPLVGPVFQPLASIAVDLVQNNEWPQVDATWAYLRTKPFQEVGNYPDEAAETFFQTLYREVTLYGWQHGGDLDARADLLLSRWSKLAPDSLIVPTLQAVRERDLGWRARGDGFANTVSEAGAAEFEKRMLSAVELLKPVLKNPEPPTRAYALAYDCAMSLGMSLDVVRNLNRNMMLSSIKYSPSAHSAVVLLLMPRWHGNPGDSEAYINMISDKLGGEAGDAMYAQLVLFMEQFHPSKDPLIDNVEYDAERLVKGLKAYYKRPRSAEYLQRGLRVLAKEEKWKLVRELVELQTQARIYVDELSSGLKDRDKEAKQAFAP